MIPDKPGLDWKNSFIRFKGMKHGNPLTYPSRAENVCVFTGNEEEERREEEEENEEEERERKGESEGGGGRER